MKTLSNTVFSISILAAAMSGALIMQPAGAAEDVQAPAVADPGPLTANVTLVNDYRYRGISQSNFQPAIQGGFDYAHESGFYI